MRRIRPIFPFTGTALLFTAIAASAMQYRVVDSFTVADAPACMPGMTRAPNGEIVVAYSTEWEPFPHGGYLQMVTSADDGRTWSEPRLILRNSDPRVTYQVANGLQTLSNGDILMPITHCLVPKTTDEETGKETYDFDSPDYHREVQLLRSVDDGRTWTLERHPEFPQPWFQFGRLLETDDGRLFMPGDSWFLVSRDHGHTWPDRITIDVPIECETNIVGADDDTFVALIRQQHGLGTRRQFITTWTRTTRGWGRWRFIDVQGKMPDLLKLPSGRVLLAVGAEGLADGGLLYHESNEDRFSFCTLFYSDDHAQFWKRDIPLEQAEAGSSVVPADSPVMCLLDDGRILIVFQAIDRETGAFSLMGNVVEPTSHPRADIVESWDVADDDLGAAGHFVTRMSDGNLFIQGPDRTALTSSDQGRTWHRYDHPVGGYPNWLSDGTILSLDHQHTRKIAADEYAYAMYRGEHTIGSVVEGESLVTIPGCIAWTGDDYEEGAITGMFFWSPFITEMPDGRLLGTMYGCMEGDTEPDGEAMSQDAIEAGAFVPKVRSIVIESRDRGLTWNYLTTAARNVLAHDPGGREIGHSGPCEPSMTRLLNGDLLIVSRIGRQAPMIQIRSTDGGQTWSPPVQLQAYGVAPTLITMSDGTLACAYGTKGDLRDIRDLRVMFSFDQGNTWELDLLLMRGWGFGTYPGICEVEPGVILVCNDIPSEQAGSKSIRFWRIRTTSATGP